MLDEKGIENIRELHSRYSEDSAEFANNFYELVPELLNTLEALFAERKNLSHENEKLWKVARAAEETHRSIFDPAKNDCVLCNAFLTACRPGCPTPGLDKALAALKDLEAKPK